MVNMTQRKLADREAYFLGILDAEPTVNSGASLGDADGILSLDNPVNDFGQNRFTIEVKCTDNKSYSLNLEILRKLIKQAQQAGNIPLLAVDIQKERFIVMPVQELLAILAYLIDMEEEKNLVVFEPVEQEEILH